MKLHVQADPNPAEFKATAAEARSAQAGAGPFGKERPALDHDSPSVQREHYHPVDRIVSLHDQRREGIAVGPWRSMQYGRRCMNRNQPTQGRAPAALQRPVLYDSPGLGIDHACAVHRGSAGLDTSAVLASATRAEIVVFSIVRDSACQECGTELFKGQFLRMEEDRPLCLGCADLDHLVFLPRGNTVLTRRASKYST